jgi:hypothetical protein
MERLLKIVIRWSSLRPVLLRSYTSNYAHVRPPNILTARALVVSRRLQLCPKSDTTDQILFYLRYP